MMDINSSLYLNDDPECGLNPLLKFVNSNDDEENKAVISWANENGIIKGIGDNKFAPNTEVTREQMAAIMFNFDSGHFYGSTGINPITIIEKYHDRIFSMHIKDKTGPKTDPTPNTNQVWGQGEMPLAEVLQYIKNKK